MLTRATTCPLLGFFDRELPITGNKKIKKVNQQKCLKVKWVMTIFLLL